jgi:hypothetical protein
MGKRRKNEFSDSLNMNMYSYHQIFDRLSDLALCRYEWLNLPETVDARYLELNLYTEGKCVFFKDDVLGFLALKMGADSNFDVYHVPINRFAIGDNGYQKKVTESDSVVIYNNMIRKPTDIDMEFYARMIWDLDRTITVNAKAQKTPIILLCDESERMTFINLYKEYDGNAPLIKGTKGLNLDSFKVLKSDAPYVGDRIYELKTRYWNEALTALGISNVSFQKKERMVSDEVNRSQGGAVMSRNSGLMMRKQACDKINAMFGLDIDVRFRETDELDVNPPFSNSDESEVDENE